MKLGVNIDHVATLRQLRGVTYPSVLKAAELAMRAGASGITAHLREDRRHMNDADLELLASSGYRLNMEMAVTDEMVAICSRLKPAACCLVPEKRQELTTEGGLDVVAHFDAVKAATETLSGVGGQSVHRSRSGTDPRSRRVRRAVHRTAYRSVCERARREGRPGAETSCRRSPVCPLPRNLRQRRARH